MEQSHEGLAAIAQRELLQNRELSFQERLANLTQVQAATEDLASWGRLTAANHEGRRKIGLLKKETYVEETAAKMPLAMERVGSQIREAALKAEGNVADMVIGIDYDSIQQETGMQPEGVARWFLSAFENKSPEAQRDRRSVLIHDQQGGWSRVYAPTGVPGLFLQMEQHTSGKTRHDTEAKLVGVNKLPSPTKSIHQTQGVRS